MNACTIKATGLSTREVQMVRKLVEAGQNLESIFWRQSDPQGLAVYQALANCLGATEKQIHHYLLINGNRYDLLEGNKPFLALGSRMANWPTCPTVKASHRMFIAPDVKSS